MIAAAAVGFSRESLILRNSLITMVDGVTTQWRQLTFERMGRIQEEVDITVLVHYQSVQNAYFTTSRFAQGYLPFTA